MIDASIALVNCANRLKYFYYTDIESYPADTLVDHYLCIKTILWHSVGCLIISWYYYWDLLASTSIVEPFISWLGPSTSVLELSVSYLKPSNSVLEPFISWLGPSNSVI